MKFFITYLNEAPTVGVCPLSGVDPASLFTFEFLTLDEKNKVFCSKQIRSIYILHIIVQKVQIITFNKLCRIKKHNFNINVNSRTKHNGKIFSCCRADFRLSNISSLRNPFVEINYDEYSDFDENLEENIEAPDNPELENEVVEVNQARGRNLRDILAVNERDILDRNERPAILRVAPRFNQFIANGLFDDDRPEP